MAVNRHVGRHVMFHWGAKISASEGQGSVLRLDLPPPISAQIDLPADFGPRFAIFADAEEEFDWTGDFRSDAVSTGAIAALPEANRFFAARGCVPTYLVDWPVVANPRSAEIIAKMAQDDECDVGAQLHPWVNPPLEERVSEHNSYVGNLPRSLEAAKLQVLTNKIQLVTGVRPATYRAGRYGVGANSAELLADQDYRLDVSVRTHFNYRSAGGPDFSAHPLGPWHAGGGLYAVPMTAAYTGLFRKYRRLPRFGYVHGLLARTGMIDRVPLTPEGVRLADARKAISQLLRDGHRLFSLSFHTPSVVPGHTPYVRNAADLVRFWAWWKGVFDLFESAGVKPIRSGEIIAAFDAALR